MEIAKFKACGTFYAFFLVNPVNLILTALDGFCWALSQAKHTCLAHFGANVLVY